MLIDKEVSLNSLCKRLQEYDSMSFMEVACFSFMEVAYC